MNKLQEIIFTTETQNYREKKRVISFFCDSVSLWWALVRCFIIFSLLYATSTCVAAGKTVAREIIVLCNCPEDQIQDEWVHKVAEMPLNHLGIVLRYHDIKNGLPHLSKDDGVRGVLTWFSSDTRMANPVEYLSWCQSVIEMGKKMVILGEPGFFEDENGVVTSPILMNRFLRNLGMTTDGRWMGLTYDMEVVDKDPTMINFERPMEKVFAPFVQMRISNRRGTSHLSLQRDDDPDSVSDLVVTSVNGGYVAEGYIIHFSPSNEKQKEIRQWYINPFEFFRRAYQTDSIPKPDTTTVAGRRIYYSHIDGDGWNNVTRIERYSDKPILSSEVILREAIAPYPDLPVTVAPIAADIDFDWVGTDESITIAKKLFTLPQVEAGSHTYSHPFYWKFFEGYTSEKERLLLPLYPYGRWDEKEEQSWTQFINLLSQNSGTAAAKAYAERLFSGDYITPRAFANHAFVLDQEISGAATWIQKLLPEGKNVGCLMWSGDTSPFEEAVRKSREAGLQNINGGDSRFDKTFPSYAWVSPIGRQVGKERTIYASNSNENTYTELWTDRFFGFRDLVTSLYKTGSPYRVKPCNIYYHLYSGEREASLNALLHNLEYVRTLEIAPIKTTHFISIAEGFYSTKIIKDSDDEWTIADRGGLQTIRFDKASGKAVDMERSQGVVGQRYLHGLLYVYLDASVEEPKIALRDNEGELYPFKGIPYLIDSRWRVWDLKSDSGKMMFLCSGYGAGAMQWQAAPGVSAAVTITNEEGAIQQQRVEADKQGVLSLTLDSGYDKPRKVLVEWRVE